MLNSKNNQDFVATIANLTKRLEKLSKQTKKIKDPALKMSIKSTIQDTALSTKVLLQSFCNKSSSILEEGIKEYVAFNLSTTDKDRAYMVPSHFLYAHYVEYMSQRDKIYAISFEEFFRLLSHELQSQRVLRVYTTEELESKLPGFVAGIYCKDEFQPDFNFAGHEVETKFINYHIDAEEIIVKDEDMGMLEIIRKEQK